MPLPPVMLAILEAGGLVPYLREHGDYVIDGEGAMDRAERALADHQPPEQT